jgi:FkbM family methyltransferase
MSDRNGRLIFDIGMHHGQDTAYYLSLGNRVVAVDADPTLIERAREKFKRQVAAGDLILVHCAIAEQEGQTLDFYLSNMDEWNSLRQEVAERRDAAKEIIKVQGRRLASLVGEYGSPYYCKIDIEGYDEVALTTLQGVQTLPTYISVETECSGDKGISEAEALQTLETLKSLGYRRFKLVDQATLISLSPDRKFYSLGYLARKAAGKLLKRLSPSAEIGYRKQLQRDLHYQFAETASGPFGEQLRGDWFDYPTSRELLLRQRRDYFKLPTASNYGFWCDWHATV